LRPAIKKKSLISIRDYAADQSSFLGAAPSAPSD